MTLVERWYEHERFQKLYAGEGTPREFLPADFLARARALSAEPPRDVFLVRAFAQEGTRRLLQQAGRCLPFAISAARVPKTGSTVEVRVRGTSLPRVIDLLDRADYLVITPETRPGHGLGTHAATLHPIDSLAFPGIMDWSMKRPYGTRTHVPPPRLLEVLAPHIFSWLEGKRATLLRFTKQHAILPYRNSYAGGMKCPLVLHHPDILDMEVARGAFAFAVDATKEHPDHIEIDTACMDIDPVPGTSYRANRLRVLDYLRFLREEVGVDPFLTHSGGKSFHVRVFVASAPDDWTYVLPRSSAWDTFARRRAAEMPAMFAGEAMELVTRAYNQWTELGPVTGREGRHDRSHRLPFLFDNRTGVRTGTRVPGSFHTGTGGIARNIAEDSVPATFAALEEAVHVRTVLGELERDHDGILAAPVVSPRARAENTRQLLAFTRGFVEASAPWLREEPSPEGGAD